MTAYGPNSATVRRDIQSYSRTRPRARRCDGLVYVAGPKPRCQPCFSTFESETISPIQMPLSPPLTGAHASVTMPAQRRSVVHAFLDLERDREAISNPG